MSSINTTRRVKTVSPFPDVLDKWLSRLVPVTVLTSIAAATTLAFTGFPAVAIAVAAAGGALGGGVQVTINMCRRCPRR